MSLFSQIGILAGSLLGVVLGVALSYIAPEELASGRKYFLILKRLLFLALFFAGNFFLIFGQEFLWAMLFTVALVVVAVLEMKIGNKFLVLLAYLPFSGICFLLPTSRALIFASITFVFGFPVGTLMRMKDEK